MTVTIDYRSPRTWITLVVFIVVVIGVGGLIGSQSTPQQAPLQSTQLDIWAGMVDPLPYDCSGWLAHLDAGAR